MKSNHAYLFATLAIYAIAAHCADINRCVGSDGKVSYQDAACDAKAKSATEMKVDTTIPAPGIQDGAGQAALQKKNAEFEQRRNARIQKEQLEDAQQAAKKREEELAAEKAKSEMEAARREQAKRGAQWQWLQDRAMGKTPKY